MSQHIVQNSEDSVVSQPHHTLSGIPDEVSNETWYSHQFVQKKQNNFALQGARLAEWKELGSTLRSTNETSCDSTLQPSHPEALPGYFSEHTQRIYTYTGLHVAGATRHFTSATHSIGDTLTNGENRFSKW